MTITIISCRPRKDWLWPC